MFQFAGFASFTYVFSKRYSLRSGFPHSDISGSKLHCQLPRAYRRLVRPSSPVIAKASATCTYSLDPITLSSFARSFGYRQLMKYVCYPLFSVLSNPYRGNSKRKSRFMQSQPYHQLSAIDDTTFFLIVKERTVAASQAF